MSRYAEHRASCAEESAATDMTAEPSDFVTIGIRELRSRAARYDRLAEILTDHRCIAVARAAARELDEQAALLERERSRRLRLAP
jgi:hypothetical protein